VKLYILNNDGRDPVHILFNGEEVAAWMVEKMAVVGGCNKGEGTIAPKRWEERRSGKREWVREMAATVAGGNRCNRGGSCSRDE